MPAYLVTITEIVVYQVPVTADNEDQAGEKAEAKIINTRNRDKWCSEVRNREVDGVEPYPKAWNRPATVRTNWAG